MKLYQCDFCKEYHSSLSIKVTRTQDTWHFCNLEHLLKWVTEAKIKEDEYYSKLAKY